MTGKIYTVRLYQNDVYEKTDQGMYFLFISYIRCASRRKWAAVDRHHVQQMCSLVIFIQELQCTTSVSAVTLLSFFHTANYSPVLFHKLQQEALLTACVSGLGGVLFELAVVLLRGTGKWIEHCGLCFRQQRSTQI